MNEKILSLIEEIDAEIKNLSFGQKPVNLYDPIYYILDMKAKRIRPLLTVLAFQLFKEDYKSIIRPALAVEVFHNFTLLHDDIMDNAPLRRGKPTVHKRWNENIAILSGDVMLVRVYDLLLDVPADLIKRIIAEFNNCAAEVCEGQQMDMDFEKLPLVTEQDYLDMIRFKTAVLLGFSLSFGGILAEAGEEDIQLLYDLGIQLGIGFQLMDDLLDVYGDHEKFGKQVGGDIITNKKTYLLIKALELAGTDTGKSLKDWINASEFDENEKVEAVKTIYDSLNIKELSSGKMNSYFDKASQNLNNLSVPEEKKESLREVIQYLKKREI